MRWLGEAFWWLIEKVAVWFGRIPDGEGSHNYDGKVRRR